jgi:hypothetical protein
LFILPQKSAKANSVKIFANWGYESGQQNDAFILIERLLQGMCVFMG